VNSKDTEALELCDHVTHSCSTQYWTMAAEWKLVMMLSLSSYVGNFSGICCGPGSADLGGAWAVER